MLSISTSACVPLRNGAKGVRVYKALLSFAAITVIGVLAGHHRPAKGELLQGPRAKSRFSQALRQQQLELVMQEKALNQERDSLQNFRANLESLKRDYNAAAAQASVAEQLSVWKWRCYRYNTLHDDPRECSEQPFRGERIMVPSPGLDRALREKAAREKALNDRRGQYFDRLRPYDDKLTKFENNRNKFIADAVGEMISNKVQGLWTPIAEKAEKNLANDKELAAELAKVAIGSSDVTEEALRTIVAYETKADKNTGKNAGGYAGLFQMGPKAASDVGYDYKTLDDPSEWRTNVAAGMAYLKFNAKQLKAKGIPITAANLYLAHQQGATGAVNMIKAVENGSAGRLPAGKNQLQNMHGLDKVITKLGKQPTQQDYYDYLRSSFNEVDSIVNRSGAPLPLP